MKVSSVVVNYKTAHDLLKFCESYDGSIEDELFIVNVSPEESDTEVQTEWAEKLGARTLSFEDNVGYARAVNQAVALATGDVLAIFNADVELRPGALHGCAEALMSREDWGILGPLQVDRQGRCTHPGIFGTLTEPEWRPGGWLSPVRPEWREVRDDAVTVMGSAYFIKADVWNELFTCPIYQSFCQEQNLPCEGAFLHTNFYYEESWASWHAHAHGYKIVFDGTREIIHSWHGAVKSQNKEDWAARQFSISQAVFRQACEAHNIPHD